MDYMQQENCLFISTNITPHKRNGRNYVLKFFSQGLEEMHHELSKDGKNDKLGDVNIPTEPKNTLGFHTSNFCFSIDTLYRINLERLFVCFAFIFILRDHHHTIFYIVLGKGMSKLIFNDTYSCMIHELLYE